MKWSELVDTTIKLLDFYSNAGNVIPSSDGNTLDATLRFPQFAQIAQVEIATTAKYIRKTKEISQNPIPNLMPNPLYMFNVIPHLGMDLTDMVSKGAKSYYFEVDNVADIYIEEETTPNTWTILDTINHTTPKGIYTSYKGFIEASSVNNNVRIRFSGDYPYNIRNRFLCAYAFPTIDDIPNYQRYVKYTMPADFYQLEKVINKGNDMLYQDTVDWQWEGRNILAVNYGLIGEIDVFYYAYPTQVPISPTDDWEFDLDEEACQAIPFYIASQVLIDDPANKSTASTLLALYQGKLANMSNVITQGAQSVKNSMFVTDGTNKLF